MNSRPSDPKSDALPNCATPRSLHIYYTIILTKSQIMERPSRVELLNAAFAVRYSADECWARGRKVGTRTPINGFGDRYATIAPPTYMVAWVGNDPTYADFHSVYSTQTPRFIITNPTPKGVS